MEASCRRATIFFGILTGIGVFVMISVGTIVVKEYTMAKSFQPTECRLQDIASLGNRSCQYCTSSSHGSSRTTMEASCRRATIFFGILTGIGVFVMISVGTIVVKEYTMAKSFQPTECRLQDIASLGNRSCQYCTSSSHGSSRRIGRRSKKSTRRCRPSSFPCVRMTVSFHDSFRDNRNATYFPDVIEMSESLLCSFFNCGPSFKSNEIQVRKRVKQFTETHAHPFTCFHSALHPGRVIGRKIYTHDAAFHGMLWPGLITGIALIGVIVTMFNLHKRLRNKPAEVPPMVELPTVPGSRLSVINNDDCSGGGTGGSGHQEKMPLREPQGESQLMNPQQSYSASALPPYLPPTTTNPSCLSQHEGHSSDQAPHPTPNNDWAMNSSLPYSSTDTIYLPPLQADSSLPSAPPPSYDSVFNR